MKSRCRDPREALAALDLPEEDPRRRHIADCPDCRAVIRAYEEFLEPSGVHPEKELDEADAELAERLRTDLALDNVPPAGGRGRGGGVVQRPFQRMWLALAAALTVAAVVLVVRDVPLLRDTRLPDGPGVSRGIAGAEAALTWTREATGSRLTWSNPPGVETAVVVLFDARMRELDRVGTGYASTLALDTATTPAGATYAQVLFVAAGDTVARSFIVARP